MVSVGYFFDNTSANPISGPNLQSFASTRKALHVWSSARHPAFSGHPSRSWNSFTFEGTRYCWFTRSWTLPLPAMLDWPDKMNTFTGAAVATLADTANTFSQSLEYTNSLLPLNRIAVTSTAPAGNRRRIDRLSPSLLDPIGSAAGFRTNRSFPSCPPDTRGIPDRWGSR